jgi:folylpolyglutamate synthase/dihydropteroate synthase
MFKQVDVVVLEVGLGGKYDATNVVRGMLIITFYSNNNTQ